MISCGPFPTLALALLITAPGLDACVPTHCALMIMCLVPDNDWGSHAARAARSAVLVWSMGEGGVIWDWLGAGVW